MNKTSKANMILTIIFAVLAVMITPDLRQTETNSTFVSQDITQASSKTAAVAAECEVDLYKLSPEELGSSEKTGIEQSLPAKINEQAKF